MEGCGFGRTFLSARNAIMQICVWQYFVAILSKNKQNYTDVLYRVKGNPRMRRKFNIFPEKHYFRESVAICGWMVHVPFFPTPWFKETGFVSSLVNSMEVFWDPNINFRSNHTRSIHWNLIGAKCTYLCSNYSFP